MDREMTQIVKLIGEWAVDRFPEEGVIVDHKAIVTTSGGAGYGTFVWVFDVEEKA